MAIQELAVWQERRIGAFEKTVYNCMCELDSMLSVNNGPEQLTAAIEAIQEIPDIDCLSRIRFKAFIVMWLEDAKEKAAS